jgi:arsenate reductase
MKKKILFLCTHNSARSQMAEGLMNSYFGDKYEAKSAGVEVSKVNPFATIAMKEIGIDISHHYSKHANEFLNEKFDFIITVCDHAKEHCPYFPGGKIYVHKSFEDPSDAKGTEEEKLAVFRKVRDQIKAWLFKNFEDGKEPKPENIGEIFVVR